MGGEKKKLTEADKGKAKMPEKKRKTKEEKDMEAVLNAARASELQSERRGIQIGEKPTPTRRTYVSRKTGTPGSVPPLPHPPTSIDDEKKKILEASQSAVTIGFVTPDKTQYESGFIVASDDNYCLVFSLSTFMAEQYIVYLEEKRAKHDAYALYKTSTHLILIVLTDKKYTPITFDHEQLEHDIVFTVGTMTGTKLHANSRAPMRELESVLGFYKGKVTVVSCGASDCANKDVRGTEKYFQLTCDVHDDIITLENVDETDHTADIVVSAPIFRSNGKSIGIISSDDVWGDTKIGMHVNSIISLIKAKVKMKKEEVWEVSRFLGFLIGVYLIKKLVQLKVLVLHPTLRSMTVICQFPNGRGRAYHINRVVERPRIFIRCSGDLIDEFGELICFDVIHPVLWLWLRDR